MEIFKTLLDWLFVKNKPTPKPPNPPPKPIPPKPGPLPEPKPEPIVEPFRASLLELHNKHRSSLLVMNESLNDAAQKHADWMARTGRMSHTGNGRSSVSDRTKKSGYPSGFVGENIAMGQRSETEVMSSWMNSAGHRANIKNSNYNDVGFGLAESNGRKFWCVVFGRS